MRKADAAGVRLRDLADICGAELVGDGDIVVDRVSSLDQRRERQRRLPGESHQRSGLLDTRASAVILGLPDAPLTTLPKLVVGDPYAAYARGRDPPASAARGARGRTPDGCRRAKRADRGERSGRSLGHHR